MIIIVINIFMQVIICIKIVYCRTIIVISMIIIDMFCNI